MQMSCMTSVYATEYSPPNMVYRVAIQADTMIAVVWSRSIITASVAPAEESKPKNIIWSNTSITFN